MGLSVERVDGVVRVGGVPLSSEQLQRLAQALSDCLEEPGGTDSHGNDLRAWQEIQHELGSDIAPSGKSMAALAELEGALSKASDALDVPALADWLMATRRLQRGLSDLLGRGQSSASARSRLASSAWSLLPGADFDDIPTLLARLGPYLQKGGRGPYTALLGTPGQSAEAVELLLLMKRASQLGVHLDWPPAPLLPVHPKQVAASLVRKVFDDLGAESGLMEGLVHGEPKESLPERGGKGGGTSAGVAGFLLLLRRKAVGLGLELHVPPPDRGGGWRVEDASDTAERYFCALFEETPRRAYLEMYISYLDIPHLRSVQKAKRAHSILLEERRSASQGLAFHWPSPLSAAGGPVGFLPPSADWAPDAAFRCYQDLLLHPGMGQHAKSMLGLMRIAGEIAYEPDWPPPPLDQAQVRKMCAAVELQCLWGCMVLDMFSQLSPAERKRISLPPSPLTGASVTAFKADWKELAGNRRVYSWLLSASGLPDGLRKKRDAMRLDRQPTGGRSGSTLLGLLHGDVGSLAEDLHRDRIRERKEHSSELEREVGALRRSGGAQVRQILATSGELRASLERDRSLLRSEAEAAAESIKARRKWRTLPMVLCPPGTFRMGQEAKKSKALIDEVLHVQVRLTKSFWVAAHPVTQDLYLAVMGKKPSDFSGAERPVERVGWLEAVLFCNRLSALAGYVPAYKVESMDGPRMPRLPHVSWRPMADGYRLPTEAEWEYAARAGEAHLYSGSGELGEVAWHMGNSGGGTHPVGTKRANAWGLFDMSGNVFEWVWDWYGEFPDSEATDPCGPSKGSHRVRRGGGWCMYAASMEVGHRNYCSPADRYNYLGFRIARNG
jgi:formylglycine-generating enzyme